MAKVIPATAEHIWPIAENMREADEIEVWLSSHRTPHQALQESFNVSVRAWTIMEGDTPIGMFGVSSVSVLGDMGIPWLLGTDGMLKVKRQFVRESFRYLDELHKLYPRLMNFVHIGNAESLRWIGWLGFKLYGPVRAGPDDAEFYKFERVADV